MPDLSPSHRPLTPGDIAILRSGRAAPYDPGVSHSTPTARYNAAGDTYEIVLGTTVLCHSPDLPVVAALLRGERFEPGFIRRVLDPACPVDEAALTNADARESARRKRLAADAAARQAAADREEARREAARPKRSVPAALSLDDLLSPGGKA